MPEEFNNDRRRFLSTAAMTIAAAKFGMIGSAKAQSIERGLRTSFDSIKQIDAGLLNIGYAEAGPNNGPAVVLLHGWPYDIHSYVDVTPLLASKGYRGIVPYLRGYGTTRFFPAQRSAMPCSRQSRSTSSLLWMLLRSRKRSSAV